MDAVKRGPVIGIVAGALGLVIAGAVAVWLLTRPAGPDAAMQAYLEALAAGDGERAAALVACTDADAAILVGAFPGATGLLTDPRVEAVSQDADTARAEISYTLDGAGQSATVALDQVSGSWQIGCSGLGTLSATSTLGDTVAVGSQLVPTLSPTALLPAVYDVTPAPVGLVTGSATAAVAMDAATEVALTPSFAPAALEQATAQVQSYLTACTAPATAVPDNCGIRVPWAADLATLDSLAFAIESLPTLAFSDDLTSFAATGGILTATAEGTTREGAQASFTYRTDEWAIRGILGATVNELVLWVQ